MLNLYFKHVSLVLNIHLNKMEKGFNVSQQLHMNELKYTPVVIKDTEIMWTKL